MSGRIERVVRLLDANERQPRPIDYWRTRSFEERLAATFELHVEGNELFRGGNPPFEFCIEIRHVGARN
jgi:hypothetical protein